MQPFSIYTPCISLRRQYQPNGRRPEGCYWSRALISAGWPEGSYWSRALISAGWPKPRELLLAEGTNIGCNIKWYALSYLSHT